MARWGDREIMQRSAAAQASRGEVQTAIDQAMALAMPWRAKNGRRDGFDALFDASGPIGTQRFASRLQRDLTPPFQRWFRLECGPLVPDDKREEINGQLELPTRIAHAVLDASAFPKASHEMYSDLAIGTGALLAVEGDDRDPIRWTSVPPWALGIEEGAGGRVDNVYFPRRYPYWMLPQHWPKAEWPASVRDKIAKRDPGLVEVLQSTYYDPDVGWRLCVQICEGQNSDCVWESEHRTNPWIVPRWWTTPGSAWGRGPLMLALPQIRTVNKTVEMVLSAAAYQLAPPMLVLHDGVVNPDRIRMAPRALIQVARTGGPMGRSLEPLDVGSNVNLAQVVLEDERAAIAKALLNEQLPPTSGAVRSASEIVERAKQLQYDAGAAFGRMNHEFVPPVIARVLDILDKKKVAGIDWKELQVDQLVLRVNVISPLARAQALDDVQNIIQWAETLKAIGGDDMLAHSAVIEALGPDLAERMGVPHKLVRPPADRASFEKAAANAISDASGGGGGEVIEGGAQPAKFATPPSAPLPVG